jgi:excisionase family DNA binding protein
MAEGTMVHQSGARPATLTVDEASKVLRIGRRQAYNAANAGSLPTIRLGRRLLILREPFEKLLSGDPSPRREGPSDAA